MASKILYPYAQWYFATAIIISWIACFSTSYFMKLGQVSIYHHLHGLCAGLWMLVMLVESRYFTRIIKIALHRQIGPACCLFAYAATGDKRVKGYSYHGVAPRYLSARRSLPVIIYRFWLIIAFRIVFIQCCKIQPPYTLPCGLYGIVRYLY